MPSNHKRQPMQARGSNGQTVPAEPPAAEPQDPAKAQPRRQGDGLNIGELKDMSIQKLTQIAKDLGLSVVETRLTRNELYTADEMFFTGTAAEITPIREVDRRAIGDGHPGPVTKKLQTAFFDILEGVDKRYDHWMTYYEPVTPKAG